MKANILLAEDNPALRGVYQSGLTSAGHLVWPAANGLAALAILRERPIELVVTDLIMPGQEGIETILAIRKLNPRLPIIAMSGGGLCPAENYLKLARTVGANRVLEKPFKIHQLLETIEELLAADSAVEAPRPRLVWSDSTAAWQWRR